MSKENKNSQSEGSSASTLKNLFNVSGQQPAKQGRSFVRDNSDSDLEAYIKKCIIESQKKEDAAANKAKNKAEEDKAQQQSAQNYGDAEKQDAEYSYAESPQQQTVQNNGDAEYGYAESSQQQAVPNNGDAEYGYAQSPQQQAVQNNGDAEKQDAEYGYAESPQQQTVQNDGDAEKQDVQYAYSDRYPNQALPSSAAEEKQTDKSTDDVVFAASSVGKKKSGRFFSKLRSGFGSLLNAMKQKPEAEDSPEPDIEPEYDESVSDQDDNANNDSFKERYKTQTAVPVKESKPSPKLPKILSRLKIEEYDDYNEDSGYITDYDDDIISRLLRKNVKPAEKADNSDAQDAQAEKSVKPAQSEAVNAERKTAAAQDVQLPEASASFAEQDIAPAMQENSEASVIEEPADVSDEMYAHGENEQKEPSDNVSDTEADTLSAVEKQHEAVQIYSAVSEQPFEKEKESAAPSAEPEMLPETSVKENSIIEIPADKLISALKSDTERSQNRNIRQEKKQKIQPPVEEAAPEHGRHLPVNVPAAHKPPEKNAEIREKPTDTHKKKELPVFDIFAEFAKEQQANAAKAAAEKANAPVSQEKTASSMQDETVKTDSLTEDLPEVSKAEAVQKSEKAYVKENAVTDKNAADVSSGIKNSVVNDAQTSDAETADRSETENKADDAEKAVVISESDISDALQNTEDEFSRPQSVSEPLSIEQEPQNTFEYSALNDAEIQEDRWHRRPKQAAQPEINDDSVYAAQPEENVVSLSDSVPESKAEEDRWHRRPKQKTPIDVSDNVVYASEKNDTPHKEKDLTEGHATTVTYHYLGNETFVVLAGKFTRTLRGEYEALREIRREAAQKLLEQKKLEEAAAAAKAEQIKKNTPKKFPKPPKNTAPEPAPLTDRAKPHSGSSEIGQDIKDEKPSAAVKLKSMFTRSDKGRTAHSDKDSSDQDKTKSTLADVLKDVEPKVTDIREIRDSERDAEEKKAEKRASKHKAAKAKKEKQKIRFSELFTNEEEFDPDDMMERKPEQKPKPQLDDYTEESDAEAIKTEIATNLQGIFARTIALAAATVAAVMLSIIAQCTALFSETIRNGWLWFAIISFIIFGISVILARNPIVSGLMPLRRFKGNSDTALAVAAVAAAMQNIAAIFTPDIFINGTLFIYTPLVILGLFLNSIGKLLIITRTLYNFNFLIKPFPKYAGKIYTDRENAQLMTSELSMQSAIIGYMCRSKFMSNFLQLSYAPDPSEKLASWFAPWTTVFSVLCGIAYGMISRSFTGALSSFALTACMSVPMVCLLAVNIPMRRLCSNTLKKGAMITGYETVTQFADTNAIMIDSSQLYPVGSVALSGMKSFKQSMLNDALLAGAAIMYKVNGTMTHVFENIVQCSRDQLPKVESVYYEDGMGLSAWVKGSRVLIGNRKILANHKIELPDEEAEERYRKMGNDVMYISVGGDLIAMFILTYKTTKNVANELHELEQNGVSFIVRTVDPNITRESIADRFGLFHRCITVLPTNLGRICSSVTSKTEERSRAYLVTRGKISSFARAVSGCIKMKSNVTISRILQCIAIVLGVGTITLISFVSGFEKLGCMEMLIYIGFWAVTTIIASSIRK